MNQTILSILLGINLIISTGVAAYVILKKETPPQTVITKVEPSLSIAPQKITVNLDKLAIPLASFNSNMSKLSNTIIRFNTSLVQYDFLKQEIQNISIANQTLLLRARAISSQTNEDNKKEMDAALEQLQKQVNQLSKLQNVYKQKTQLLILGLEKQLQVSSGVVPTKTLPKTPTAISPAIPSPTPKVELPKVEQPKVEEPKVDQP